MTREEALKLLENEIYKWSMDWDEGEDGLDYTEAIEIAIAALRPVSREQPTLTPPKEATYPCDLCVYNPPSSLDGKPCTYCPATGRPPEGEEGAP